MTDGQTHSHYRIIYQHCNYWWGQRHTGAVGQCRFHGTDLGSSQPSISSTSNHSVNIVSVGKCRMSTNPQVDRVTVVDKKQRYKHNITTLSMLTVLASVGCWQSDSRRSGTALQTQHNYAVNADSVSKCRMSTEWQSSTRNSATNTT